MTTHTKTTAIKTKLSLLTSLILMTGATTAHAETAQEYSPLVFGSTYVSAGASAEFGGDIVANTYLVVGASTNVAGTIKTGTAITIGAKSLVGEKSDTGAQSVAGTYSDTGEFHIESGTATTIGADTTVDGDASYGTALTLGAGAQVDSQNAHDTLTNYTSGQINDAQGYYNDLTAADEDDRNELPTLIARDMTLNESGDAETHPSRIGLTSGSSTIVYNASSLTTAASITLTLGKAGDNIDWVFNITDMMTLGANTKIVLAEGSTGSVTWNLGGYASLGAGADMVGTILAGGYVTTGASSKVTGAPQPSRTHEDASNYSIVDESFCGGFLSATSYVTLGASATVNSCDNPDTVE